MNQIDLIFLAENSKRLPKSFLSVLIKKKNNLTWKLLTSHFVDFFIITLVASTLSLVLFNSIKTVIIVEMIQNIINKNNFWIFLSLMLPPLIFVYFFCSYFLNHGQSYGMFLMKKRLAITSKSFIESLVWSSHSTFLCLSFGISYFFKSTKWTQFKEHDYLYHDLLAQIEICPISLIAKITEFEEQSIHEKIEWGQAS
jgi:hypothetical protein